MLRWSRASCPALPVHACRARAGDMPDRAVGGELAKAIADYDAVLAKQPREARSLYARGIAERRVGGGARADAASAVALTIDPEVAGQAKRRRLE